MRLLGGIEAGGTKFVCATATGPQDIRDTTTLRTTTPSETIATVISFFRTHGSPSSLAAVGLASFGPLDLDSESPTFGSITATPKPGWANTSIVTMLVDALQVPVAVDTDVNAAALAEYRWGEAKGMDPLVYITVGTGIGLGGVFNGRLMHGLVHPEAGHIRIPHDVRTDPFSGSCPFHGDCLEGLASGPAMTQRWGQPPDKLGPDHEAWQLEAFYVALGIVAVICCVSPRKIVLGGGIMGHEGLHEMVRASVRRILGGYIQSPFTQARIDEYIIPPSFGKRSGILGAVALAEDISEHPATQ